MTREEEIKQAAEEHAKSSLVGSLYYKESSFRQGAEWADEHPRKGLVDIDDVCRYIENCTWPIESVKDKFIFSDELRKAMEE